MVSRRHDFGGHLHGGYEGYFLLVGIEELVDV